jgi:hypothetical protein
MLCRPDDVETALFGHLHHVQRMACHLLHGQAGVHAFQVDCELKFHLLSPDPIPGHLRYRIPAVSFALSA